MMNLAVKQDKSEVNPLVQVIEKMSNDSEFYGNVINSKNLESFLESNGFVLGQAALDILNASAKKIKDMVNEEVKIMTGQLFELVTNISLCNGTGW